MAEILGIASSIAGLLSLTIEIFSITTNYVRGVREASKTAKDLIKELKELKVALSLFDDLVNECSDDLLEDASPLLASISLEDIKEYRELLSSLQSKLEKIVTGNPGFIKAKKLL